MATRAEEAIRRKSDREEKRRKRRGEVPEVSPEEEEDMYLPDGSRNPKYYREESDQPIAMDEFKDEAISSDGFNDEEPQGTFEEEAAEEEAPAESMGQLENSILSDAEKKALSDSFTAESQELGMPGNLPEGTRANNYNQDNPQVVAEYANREKYKDIAEETDKRIHQEALRNAGHGMSFDEALGAPGATDATRDLAEAQKKQRVYDQWLAEKTRKNESLAGHLDAANKPYTTGIAPEDSEWIQRGRDNEAAAKAEAEAAAAESESVIHEKDKATAAEMAARFAARGAIKDGRTGGSYTRSAVEPPMTNRDGKKLGSIYYDPTLKEVKNIVDARGVIIDREVVDLKGAREEDTATQKRKGMVWMIPSEGGFKTGDQRFAGQGPGRWMREDQALAADTTNIERPIEEARRQAVYDKKKRTPLEVREDNLRAKREHEENLKRIEFGKDDDLEDEAKIEMKIKRFTALLQQPGLTAEERRNYQQQLNSLLSGGEVGGAPAGDASDGPSVSDVSNDFALVDPELETDLDSMLDHYVGDDYGVTNPLNPYDWGQTFQGIFGGEINSSNEMGLGYLAGQLSGMFQQGRLKDDPAFLVNLKAKILQKMDPAVINRLDDPDEADLSAEEWQLVRDFFGPLLADPPTMPTNVDTISDENMGWGWIGQSGGWGN